jgi:SPP1 gp7 family putative phage head morphogenesis protein
MKKKLFESSASAETQFARALRKVARVASHIVESHTDGIKISGDMMAQLENYSKLIGPWAARQSAKMLEQVQKANRRDYTSKNRQIAGKFQKNSQQIAKELRLNVSQSLVGAVANALMLEQVTLIKSIPLEAGMRAQQLAQEAFYSGTRADDIAAEIAKTNEVTESRAVLIARTETARANAKINQARANSVGSRQYRWHNSGDGAVRESHKVYRGKKLQGMIFGWDSPPTLDDGMTGHPGTFPNCRCFAEPIFDEE